MLLSLQSMMMMMNDDKTGKAYERQEQELNHIVTLKLNLHRRRLHKYIRHGCVKGGSTHPWIAAPVDNNNKRGAN